MASTLMTVAEVDPFAATAKRAGLADAERQEITIYLAQRPEAGDVIPGTGGLRKLRWPGGGKGKRGGYRVIYYFFGDAVPLYLLAVYPKTQQVDLSPREKARLAALADDLKATARRRVKARRASR